MSNPTVTLVYGDDWAGIYYNGRLEKQGHSIAISDMLHLLGISYKVKDLDLEWLHERGKLPAHLSDVKTID